MTETLTIELSADVVARMRASAEAYGLDLNTYAVAAMDAMEADAVLDDETSADVVAAGWAAIEDERAGRLHTMDEVVEAAEAAIREVEQRLRGRAA